MARLLSADASTDLDPLLACLRRDGVLAVPTDTIYGLAANALSAAAVAAVFRVKGRPEEKAMPLVVAGMAQAEAVAGDLPPLFHALAAAYWPGPLTLVVRARPELPRNLLAGGETVALRQPAAPFLLRLLEAAGFPLTATSANRSGEAGCRSAAEVLEQLGDRLEYVLDGGPSASALPSTIVDLTAPSPRLIRSGAIGWDKLKTWLETTAAE